MCRNVAWYAVIGEVLNFTVFRENDQETRSSQEREVNYTMTVPSKLSILVMDDKGLPYQELKEAIISSLFNPCMTEP